MHNGRLGFSPLPGQRPTVPTPRFGNDEKDWSKLFGKRFDFQQNGTPLPNDDSVAKEAAHHLNSAKVKIDIVKEKRLSYLEKELGPKWLTHFNKLFAIAQYYQIKEAVPELENMRYSIFESPTGYGAPDPLKKRLEIVQTTMTQKMGPIFKAEYDSLAYMDELAKIRYALKTHPQHKTIFSQVGEDLAALLEDAQLRTMKKVRDRLADKDHDKAIVKFMDKLVPYLGRTHMDQAFATYNTRLPD